MEENKKLSDQDIADITAAANSAVTVAKGVKTWYSSKTLKTNAVIIVLIIAQAVAGQQIVNPEAQALFIAVINMALRFITKQPII